MADGETPIPHFDVLIVGAGLSGIGAAVHLTEQCPGRTYAILERRQAVGGTWDLFRYPGIRSDSDMHTLGFNFKPWEDGKAIADGPAIRKYVDETANEHGVKDHIRFGHQVVSADWDSVDGRWTVTAAIEETGETASYTATMLLMCAGYYNYDGGHAPKFDGQDRFQGEIIHPQHWPEDLDYADKNVVVIGSGATAVTLVPAMAETAARVTMLQRSPTYVVSRPGSDAIANTLRKIFPPKMAYAMTRWKNVQLQNFFYKRARTKPDDAREQILKRVKAELGPDFDVETHFSPRYNPWDPRICLVPDSDLFKAIKSGKAKVVTDQIIEFDETGILTASGKHLDADIIVTATGLKLSMLGEAVFRVNGEPLNVAQTFTYRGLGFSGVPNLFFTFGYINASWTLRADLVSEFACRVLNHMAETGTTVATPTLRPHEQSMAPRPYIEGFSAGYMQRAMHLFPKQGDHAPWTNPQLYAEEKKTLPAASMTDGTLAFTKPAGASGIKPSSAATETEPQTIAAE